MQRPVTVHISSTKPLGGPICQRFNCSISSYCMRKVHGMYDMPFRYKLNTNLWFILRFSFPLYWHCFPPSGCNWRIIELGAVCQRFLQLGKWAGKPWSSLSKYTTLFPSHAIGLTKKSPQKKSLRKLAVQQGKEGAAVEFVSQRLKDFCDERRCWGKTVWMWKELDHSTQSTSLAWWLPRPSDWK